MNQQQPSAIYGRIVDRSTPSLVVGSDAFIVTQIAFRESKQPYSFSQFVGATASFQSADDPSTPVNFIGALESADLGTVRFDMAASGTALMLAGDPISFQQELKDARGTSIIIFSDALTVVDGLFG